jgi:adenylate kinase
VDRIDFLGTSGVGKSTIYNKLVKNRSKIDNWMTPEEAKIKIAQKYSIQNNALIKNRLIAVSLKVDLFKKLHPILANAVIEKNQEDTIWVNKDKYTDFFEVALRGANIQEKIPLRRLSGIRAFYATVRDVIFLEHAQIPGIILFDESLSLRIYAVTMWRKGYYEEATIDYFNNIPPPFGIIHCKLDPDKTLSRIIQRKNTCGNIIQGHRDLDNNHLLEVIKAQNDIAAVGANVLRNRGVKVLEIDTDDSIENIVKKITTAIRRDFA